MSTSRSQLIGESPFRGRGCSTTSITCHSLSFWRRW